MPTLNWLTRDEDLVASRKVPYRLLEEVPELSCTERDPQTENMLIQGDNLEALKSLLPFYAGKVKCIFIDPPYNTKSAFEHYDDNLEHSQWLAMMYPRLELLRELLSEDGSIWVTIDDNEAHYLKVIMDEVLGRQNFVANVIWQKSHTRENRTDISTVHDNLLVFARNREIWQEVRNPLPASESQLGRYTNEDSDPRGPWASLPAHAKAEKGRRKEQFFTIKTPSGRLVDPPPGRCWLYTEPRLRDLIDDKRIWFGSDGRNVPRVKKFLSEVQDGLVPSTLWFHLEVGTTGAAKRQITDLFENLVPFSTPKPEQLVARVVQIASEEKSIVLDSFLGSGTTAAVAQKMGRNYIGIEMGNHAETHCAPRLRKVIEGEQGGISEAVGWKGGGGFRFYRLGKTVFDEEGRISEGIKFEHLAAHVWFSETRTPRAKHTRTPLLGVHDGTAYYLLYNGVLGDKRPGAGNVLTRRVLSDLAAHVGPKVIYGESCRLSAGTLKLHNITFKQTPYDVRAR